MMDDDRRLALMTLADRVANLSEADPALDDEIGRFFGLMSEVLTSNWWSGEPFGEPWDVHWIDGPGRASIHPAAFTGSTDAALGLAAWLGWHVTVTSFPPAASVRRLLGFVYPAPIWGWSGPTVAISITAALVRAQAEFGGDDFAPIPPA